jgi:hypothetical protein
MGKPNWAFADLCATDHGVFFKADGTYDMLGSDEGRYEVSGSSITLFERTTVGLMGEEEADFTAEVLDDIVLPVGILSRDSITLDGTNAIRC